MSKYRLEITARNRVALAREFEAETDAVAKRKSFVHAFRAGFSKKRSAGVLMSCDGTNWRTVLWDGEAYED